MSATISTDFDHPKHKELLRLGCSNVTQVNMTFLTYMDLCEVKNWCNVKVHLLNKQDCLILMGHEGPREVKEFVLPLTSDASMTMPEMRSYLTAMQKQFNTDSVILAFVAEDWSITYFRITDGFQPPDPPEALEDKRAKRRQRWQSRQSRYVSLARMPGNYASQLPDEPDGRSTSAS